MKFADAPAHHGVHPRETAHRPILQLYSNVSWHDCQEFLDKLNAFPAVSESGLVFRLPSEDEWAYACRAGAEREPIWGNEKSKYCLMANGTAITRETLRRVAWFKGAMNANGRPHPVGRKEPNAFGLYDMLGNVDEWTLNETGSERILRGGGWGENAWHCVSRWGQRPPNGKYDDAGFRLCATAR